MTHGKVRFLPTADPRVPPRAASGQRECLAELPNSEMRKAEGYLDDQTCPWLTPEGECHCDAPCSRPPHDPSEVHASHGTKEACVWGGE